MSENLGKAKAGEWPKLKLSGPLPHLLGDGPVDPPYIHNLFEQSEICSGIQRIISGHFSNTDAEFSHPNILVALHGRLGQGKSRVIHNFIVAVDRRQLGTNKRRTFSRKQLLTARTIARKIFLMISIYTWKLVEFSRYQRFLPL